MTNTIYKTPRDAMYEARQRIQLELETLVGEALRRNPMTQPEDWEICYGPSPTQFAATKVWVQRKKK